MSSAETGVQLGHQVSEEDIKRYREIFQLVSLMIFNFVIKALRRVLFYMYRLTEMEGVKLNKKNWVLS